MVGSRRNILRSYGTAVAAGNVGYKHLAALWPGISSHLLSELLRRDSRCAHKIKQDRKEINHGNANTNSDRT
jgi:hypothetical protein